MPETLFAGIPDPEPPEPGQRRRLLLFVFVPLAGLGLAVSLATPRQIPWTVSDGKLQIHARVWNEDFPLAELRTDQAWVLDLNRQPDWKPQKKSWGFDGFGLTAGRFVLRNGQSADIYLANETTAVVIPRQGDVSVIVGVQQPQAFLNALHEAAPRGGRAPDR